MSNKKFIYLWGSSQSYSRTQVLIEGLKANGYHIKILVPNKKNKIFGKIELLYKFFAIPKNSIVFLPSLNHINSLFLRVLNVMFHKKIYSIFDPLVSRYDTLVNDRKLIEQNSIKSFINKKIDEMSMKWVDCLLADTNEHKIYFVEKFKIKQNKVIEVPVGAPNIFIKNQWSYQEKKVFIVVFYGTYIPLHGIETILNSFSFLKDYPIELKLIGSGQTYKDMVDLANNLELKNVRFYKSMEYEQLISTLLKSDVGLGIFGESEKASRVVPNKVFQMAAMGIPIITQNSIPVKRFFGDDIFYVDAGNPQSLADKILNLYKSKELLIKKGKSLRQKTLLKYKPEILARILIDYLETRKMWEE